MTISNNHIPLIASSCLSAIAVFLSTSIAPLIFDPAVIIGFICIGLTWISILLKRKIWVYLLLITLILSTFTSFVSISYINFTLHFGSFGMNILVLALLIAHLVMSFGDPIEEKPPVPEGGWTKINVIKHEYRDTPSTEIKELLQGELTSDKRQALEEILESRTIH